VELTLSAAEAVSVMEMMKARIRRLSHLEKAGTAEFAEVSRGARICYSLCQPENQASRGLVARVPHLSREDLETLYALPLGPTEEGLLKDLNEVRMSARSGGPVDPVAADRAAKSVVQVMED